MVTLLARIVIQTGSLATASEVLFFNSEFMQLQQLSAPAQNASSFFKSCIQQSQHVSYGFINNK
jgi:hypothetical protein